MKSIDNMNYLIFDADQDQISFTIGDTLPSMVKDKEAIKVKGERLIGFKETNPTNDKVRYLLFEATNDKQIAVFDDIENEFISLNKNIDSQIPWPHLTN
ncbi:hypothetical protein [uncultured Vagococcus sp.]|uniref:hypothetical protein n=1 Tax=uncultured Vagococcus sp. TaxID=189676 RepID=UPI0028D0BDCA|nr:hypothetical protein [uncultured Vagococcus sp.]